MRWCNKPNNRKHAIYLNTTLSTSQQHGNVLWKKRPKLSLEFSNSVSYLKGKGGGGGASGMWDLWQGPLLLQSRILSCLLILHKICA